MGTVSVLWIVVWIYLVHDSPDQQSFISLAERNLINSTSGVSDRPSFPWKKVFTSLPFIAILVAHVCFNWGWYTILIGASSYFEEVLDFNIKENAIASVPLITMWLFSIILAKILEVLCRSEKLTTTVARKVATLIAFVVPMVCLLVLCFIGNTKIVTGIILGIGEFCLAKQT